MRLWVVMSSAIAGSLAAIARHVLVVVAAVAMLYAMFGSGIRSPR
jgi:hypothetical protein